MSPPRADGSTDLTRHAFRESDETFRQLAENLSDAFWIRSPDMRTVHYVSPAFERIWGRPVSSLYDHPERWSDYLHPDDRERVTGAFGGMVGDARSLDIEFRIVRPDGEVRWVHSRGFQVLDGSNAVCRLAGIVTDITDRKHAEAEQVRLHDAVVRVAAGVSGATGVAFFHQLAASMAQALGAQAAFVARWLPSQPTTARTIAAWIDGVAVADTDFLIATSPCEALLTQESCVVSGALARQFPDAPLLTDIGADTVVAHALHTSSKQPLGLLLLMFREPLLDVAFTVSTLQIFAARAASELERQQTDAQVREQAALLDVAHDAIQVRDLDGRILYWNKGSERLFGWTAAEVIGKETVGLLYKDPTNFDDAHASLVARGEWHGEVTKQTRDGREITIDARWTLVRDTLGRPTSILAINTDVTARKRLESQFLRAQRMEGIGTLAGGIAHDLNNVLAPILMSIDMLKGVVAGDQNQALIATLDASAQRGAELVKQVLSYARGVDGRRIPVNMLLVVRDLLQVIRDTFPKSIEVLFTPPAELWTIRGDPSQMQQVLLNLCVNARDAMPEGGTLTIAIRDVVLDKHDAQLIPEARPGSFVMVRVADNGTGIPADIRDRIFEPFFTTREIGKGTGLGLSTTHAIVHSHRGFIQVYSEVGKGTTFNVYLPAPTTRAVETVAAVESVGPPTGHGELILIVDDEEAIRRVGRRLLERFGYRVITAKDGADALVVYAAHRPDVRLVLTDMAMPVMDGPALVAALRAVDPFIHVVGSSGLAPAAGVPGMEHFVSKPYAAAAMLQTLHDALHHIPSQTS